MDAITVAGSGRQVLPNLTNQPTMSSRRVDGAPIGTAVRTPTPHIRMHANQVSSCLLFFLSHDTRRASERHHIASWSCMRIQSHVLPWATSLAVVVGTSSFLVVSGSWDVGCAAGTGLAVGPGAVRGGDALNLQCPSGSYRAIQGEERGRRMTWLRAPLPAWHPAGLIVMGCRQ